MFSSTSRLYRPMIYCENPEEYREGGLHPFHLNDQMQQYTIVHKLGHGSYSTVWAALDGKNNRLLALKCLTARNSKDSNDLTIIRRVSIPGTHAGQQYISTLVDQFDWHGPNGTHQCLLTALRGPSLSLIFDEMPCPHSVARDISIQCAKGLSFLHSRGVVHGGACPC